MLAQALMPLLNPAGMGVVSEEAWGGGWQEIRGLDLGETLPLKRLKRLTNEHCRRKNNCDSP